MEKLIDTVEAEITCSQCGRKEKHAVSWYLENTSSTCPMCGETQDLTAPEWKAKIQAYIDACQGFDG